MSAPKPEAPPDPNAQRLAYEIKQFESNGTGDASNALLSDWHNFVDNNKSKTVTDQNGQSIPYVTQVVNDIAKLVPNAVVQSGGDIWITPNSLESALAADIPFVGHLLGEGGKVTLRITDNGETLDKYGHEIGRYSQSEPDDWVNPDKDRPNPPDWHHDPGID